jgi:hypothetical protein
VLGDAAGVDDGLALADELKGREVCRGFRVLRRAGGASLRGQAKVIGVNPSTLSRWERGLLLPAGDHARALLRAAEVLAADRSSG